jgi:hypothetical protein
MQLLHTAKTSPTAWLATFSRCITIYIEPRLRTFQHIRHLRVIVSASGLEWGDGRHTIAGWFGFILSALCPVFLHYSLLDTRLSVIGKSFFPFVLVSFGNFWGYFV